MPTRRPVRAVWLLVAVTMTASCTGLARVAPPAIPRPTATPTSGATGLAALTYSLEVGQSAVIAGGEVEYTLVVRNDTGSPVHVPDCETSRGRQGIIPVDDATAPLWMQWIIECAGPRVLVAGEEERSTMTAYAHDQQGTPHEPGEYLLGRHVALVPGRLLVPITVVAAE